MSMLAGKNPVNHRKSLGQYSEEVLNAYLSVFATSSWLSWALFTFFESPPIIIKPKLLYSILPLTISGTSKYLMLTVPVVIYGVMRYLEIIFEGAKAESPERVLFYDRSLFLTVAIWGIMVIFIIYGAS